MTEAERTITTPEETPDAAPGETAATAADPAGHQAAAHRSGVPEPAVDDISAGRPGGGAGPGANRRVPVLIGVAALAYLLDLLSKIWVVNSLENHDSVHLLGHYLRLDAIRNAGAAFGLGQGMTVVFTVIAVGVIVVIVRLSRKLYSVPWAIALGLLLGGAFGNLTDRVFRSPGGFQGRVVDFIAPAHFAVFNLADSAITCGGVLIVLLSFRGVEPDGTRHRD